MSERQHKQRDEQHSGILQCTGCGMKFKVTDGESVYIDHFEECEGSDDG